jgi:hypothetical protein
VSTPPGFDLWAALRSRYPAGEWAFFAEVRNSTGFANDVRTADAMAFGLWPSRGLELHGFEVKVSRSDWMREKKNPAKAETMAAFTDKWWLVVSDADIVRDGELPPSWGLLVPRGRGLFAKVEATKLEAKPFTRQFTAALMRKLSETYVDPATVEEKVRARIEAEKANWEHQQGDSGVRRQFELLKESVAEFQKASGVTIGDWDGGDIGKAVAFIRQHGVTTAIRDLKRQVECLRNLAAHGERLLANAPETESGT